MDLLSRREILVMVDLHADFVRADAHAALQEAAEIDGVDHLAFELVGD
jgi:hypothetical protein